MMSPEFWAEVEHKPRPAPAPKFDPGYCRTAFAARVPVGDFRTAYTEKVPGHEIETAVRAVQRSRKGAPFCPYTNTLAVLVWRLDFDGVARAHWFCVDCATKARINPPGKWIAAQP